MSNRLPQLSAVAAAAADLLLLSRLSTTVVYTATTISAQASDNSLNDSAGQWLVEGFAAGMTIDVAGFTGTPGNNSGAPVIVSATASKLVLAGVTLVDDAAGESVTVTAYESKRTTAQEVANLATAVAGTAHVVNGRLTTQSGAPVSRGDRVAQSTLHLTPYKGNEIRLWNGTAWQVITFTQASLALSGLTAGILYDVYAHLNAGVPVLSLVAWRLSGGSITAATNATPIAVTTAAAHGLTTGDEVYICGVKGNTAANGLFDATVTGASTLTLDGSVGNGAYVEGGTISARVGATKPTLQDGVYCKADDKTRLYLGTIYATGATTTEDSESTRGVWNNYNRVRRELRKHEVADTWGNSAAAWQAANASSANRLNVVVGLPEDAVDCEVHGAYTSSAATIRNAAVGICINGTGWSNADTSAPSSGSTTAVGNPSATLSVNCAGLLPLQWVDRGAGSDIQTWYGDAGETVFRYRTGIMGKVWA